MFEPLSYKTNEFVYFPVYLKCFVHASYPPSSHS
jgi:hypothetical protein